MGNVLTNGENRDTRGVFLLLNLHMMCIDGEK
jgi:hypothetical protein